MRSGLLILLLTPLVLGATEPPLRLDLRITLGEDPLARIQLVPPGIWNQQLLGLRPRAPRRSAPRHLPGATVQVLDFLLPENPRQESFRIYRLDLQQRLLLGFRTPPPSQAGIELGEFMQSDPSHPEASNLDRARSLQNRYNLLPPGGSPVETPR